MKNTLLEETILTRLIQYIGQSNLFSLY